MKRFNKTFLAISITLASSQAMAAGFQLNSQSATGLGRAMAGDAVIADNASVLSRNPAAMALFKDKAVSLGITYADVQVEVDNVSSSTTDFGSDDSAGSGKIIPNAYYIQPINESWAMGFAAFSNFGTGTDTSDITKNTTANTQAPIDLLGETEITSIDFNASVSYRFNEYFSLGLGVDFVYGTGKLTRNGPLYFPGTSTVIVADQTVADVEASGWGVGGIAGLVYEINENNRIGLSYRYSPTINADGDNNDSVGALTSASTYGYYNQIEIPLPNIAQLGGFHQITEHFALSYTAQYTQWGEFDRITLLDCASQTSLTSTTPTACTDPGSDYVLKEYQWDDSWLFSVGGTYDINDTWTARIGYMYDQGVVGDLSSLSIPDSDRNWYTGGVSYHFNQKSSLDLGIAFVRGKKTHLTETSSLIGDVTATTSSNAVYYSMQYSYNF
ncbi:OmpP1/FadL family transporter [uncultured Shewanella sp.]|uniref:OmpP1/FadL family transporter n=1 Tax=uncultured Shewanella sp. TaxID=173975 RepID=UPI00262BACFB|nr:OmpP1/FadL family transporter [uncultured Shewanella sp.]